MSNEKLVFTRRVNPIRVGIILAIGLFFFWKAGRIYYRSISDEMGPRGSSEPAQRTFTDKLLDIFKS